MANVAFIGLGVMGFPMAGHLASGGHAVTVFNRTPARAAAFVARFGGRAAATPRDAAHGAEFIFTCVGNDDDLREVTIGPDGAFSGMSAGAILADHTTASAEVARELAAKAADRGLGFLDAPVSGGQAGAENGILTIMVGGDAGQFARAKPVLEAYGRSVALMGGPGSGQLAKMVNQISIAGIIQGLAEAIHFAERSGLDVAAAMAAISRGAGQSWYQENRWQTMAGRRFDFGFAVDLMRKDLGICLDEARRNGATLPVAALVDQFYAEVQRLGGNRWDASSLIARLDRG